MQQQQPQQYTASAPYPAMMPMVSHPTFRRIKARHAIFKVGVGGIFLSALLFIVGYSAPAWIDQSGLWMSCGSSCVSNVASGSGDVSCVVRTCLYPHFRRRLPVTDFDAQFLSRKMSILSKYFTSMVLMYFILKCCVYNYAGTSVNST